MDLKLQAATTTRKASKVQVDRNDDSIGIQDIETELFGIDQFTNPDVSVQSLFFIFMDINLCVV